MSWFKPKRIFMDYASATPLLPEARRAMENFWSLDFYNPSAIYEEGREAKKLLEDHRTRFAKLLGIGPKSVIFTSGGTESSNLAILGAFEAFRQTPGNRKPPHIIVSAIEHPAVIRAAEEVKSRGGELTILPVGEDGVISIETLKPLIKKNTFLVSVGLANSEIGTVQPVSKVGRLLREYRKANNTPYPYLHTDASQAANHLSVALENLQADLLTLDAAKIYGPKGVGALVARAGVKLKPTMLGGGQESGLRAGTVSTALVAGFVRAFELAFKYSEKEAKRHESMRSYFIEKVAQKLPNAVFNGSPSSHLPNIVSVSVPGVLSELLLLKLDSAGLMVSVGSACSYDERESGSPVIRAIGKPELAESTLRFSFGRMTTPDEVKKAVEIFCRVASKK